MTDTRAGPPRPTAPPVFAATILPFAAAVGFVTVAAPYWLAREGVPLSLVGAVSGTAMLPHAFKFLWAPLIDAGGRRRAWFAGATAATAALLAALGMLPDSARRLGAFVALATAAQLAATTAAAASDGLMAATTRAADRGKAGGWRMAGNVGGTGILGALALWVAARGSRAAAGLALAAVVVAAGLAAARIHEPREPAGEPPRPGLLLAARARMAAVLRDLWRTVASREGWTGLVICAVPVGAGALTNLFSAMALEYRASEGLVAAVSGLGGGLAGAAGSLAGGWVADRMNRRLAYALAGLLTAATAFAMMIAPMTPLSYAAGALAYNLATGFAFAALAAFVLETAGHGAAAASKYTLFIAVANVASSYVTALDGWASSVRGWGARGALAADVLLTLAGIGVLLLLVASTRRAPGPAPEAAAAP